MKRVLTYILLMAVPSALDEVFKSKERQIFAGTLITGIGLTVTTLGVCILTTKP